jgi:hypothetical protein
MVFFVPHQRLWALDMNSESIPDLPQDRTPGMPAIPNSDDFVNLVPVRRIADNAVRRRARPDAKHLCRQWRQQFAEFFYGLSVE